jgi:hypothetical protein
MQQLVALELQDCQDNQVLVVSMERLEILVHLVLQAVLDFAAIQEQLVFKGHQGHQDYLAMWELLE